MRIRRWIDLAAIAVVAIPMAAYASESAPQQPVKTETVKQTPPAPADEKALKAKLDEKIVEMASLKDKASTVTKNLSALTATGNIPTSQEALQAMREMINELAAIQETLEKIQEEIEGIKGWIEGQNEALPIMAGDISDLKRSRWGNYLQFQYRDTNQVGGATDAFSVRRARLGLTQQIDPRTVLRVSFDVATGTTTNSAQMRDAFVRWDLEPSLEKVGTEVSFGQMPLSLGYELERSSGEREFPERTLYNRTLFAGERSRGINIKHGVGQNAFVHLGGWNALTFDDPEQRNSAPGTENRLAMSGGVRVFGTQWDLGLSGFFGERPKIQTTRTVNNATVTTTHPRVDREIIYLDGTYVGLIDPKLFVKFEYMTGKDRIPIVPGAQSSITAPRGRVDVEGHQVHLGYNINARNQLNIRREQWDPNTEVDGNVVTTWAAAYSYFINPNARITLAQEWVEDPSRANVNDTKYKITTLRVVFRF